MANFLLTQGSAGPAAPAARAGNATQREIQQAIEAANGAVDAARANRASGGRDFVLARPGGNLTIHEPGVPTTVQDGWNEQRDLPRGVIDISIGFFAMCAFIAVGWPLARALGRRLERRVEPAAATPALAEQLQRIEQAVDAMSIEVERISESQRFLTKLQSGAAADRLPVPR